MVKVNTTMEPEVDYEVDQREADEMANRGYLVKDEKPQAKAKPEDKSKPKAEEKVEDKAEAKG